VAGRLVGSISESDLRRITPGHFDVLAMVWRCKLKLNAELESSRLV
jgi:hypothetical protein